MMLKTLLAATAMIVSPLLAFAECSHSDAAISCAEGTTYDTATNTCKVVTG